MLGPQKPSYFQVGGSLSIDAPSYVKRQADEMLYRSLLEQEFCHVLNARQMGKSSLRVQTQHRLQAAGIRCGTIDLAAIGTQQITPNQWYASVFGSLVSSLQLPINLRSWWRSHCHLPLRDRLHLFLETVLLVPPPTVIFIEEIDSVLSLNFPVDDFFEFIHFCYKQRSDRASYRCLSFVLLGVAAPNKLMADPSRSPFQIGRAIELKGFEFSEAAALLPGLAAVSPNPEVLLHEILDWTGGQPFLTQKVCQLVRQRWRAGTREPLAAFIRSHFIDRWELQDEPAHLRIIRDRLCDWQKVRQLKLSKELLEATLISVDGSLEQTELLLTGLVEPYQGSLRIKNAIYQAVFNLS